MKTFEEKCGVGQIIAMISVILWAVINKISNFHKIAQIFTYSQNIVIFVSYLVHALMNCLF